MCNQCVSGSFVFAAFLRRPGTGRLSRRNRTLSHTATNFVVKAVLKTKAWCSSVSAAVLCVTARPYSGYLSGPEGLVAATLSTGSNYDACRDMSLETAIDHAHHLLYCCMDRSRTHQLVRLKAGHANTILHITLATR
jgi:hypothetical protein